MDGPETGSDLHAAIAETAVDRPQLGQSRQTQLIGARRVPELARDDDSVLVVHHKAWSVVVFPIIDDDLTTRTKRGIEVTVSGGRPWGIANIWDWDLIMWLLAQLRQAIDASN